MIDQAGNILNPQAQQLTQLLALVTVLWLAVLVYTAVRNRGKGVIGAFNTWLSIIAFVLIGTTIGSYVLFDLAPRQAAARLNGSPAQTLLETAFSTGPTIVVGQAQPGTTSSVPAGQPTAAAGAPVQNTPAPAVNGWQGKIWVTGPVRVQVPGGDLYLLKWDGSGVSRHLQISEGAICGWWLPVPAPNQYGFQYTVSCEATPELIDVAQLTLPDSAPRPPMPTPTPSAAELAVAAAQQKKTALAACAQTWSTWASSKSLGSTTEHLGAGALPAGTTWVVSAPDGWTRFWVPLSKQNWILTSSELGVLNYSINGEFGYSIAPEGGSVTGTGAMCASTP